MREPIGSDGWYICDWRDHPDFAFTEFRGTETFALQWANRFRGDMLAMAKLRRLISGTFSPLSDEEIAQEVARRLTRGAWLARRRLVKWASSAAEKLPAEAAAFPNEAPRPHAPPPRAPGPTQDPPLFPDDIDPVAIAEVQKRAAALGVPFCEECLRARMATE